MVEYLQQEATVIYVIDHLQQAEMVAEGVGHLLILRKFCSNWFINSIKLQTILLHHQGLEPNQMEPGLLILNPFFFTEICFNDTEILRLRDWNIEFLSDFGKFTSKEFEDVIKNQTKHSPAFLINGLLQIRCRTICDFIQCVKQCGHTLKK